VTRRSPGIPARAGRLSGVLTADEHVPKAVTWDHHQEIIATYDESVAREAELWMFKLIKRTRAGVSKGLTEPATLGWTLRCKRAAILAYFDTGTLNGSVEAINGRLEHLRGIAPGYRSLDHFILRSMIHSDGGQEEINTL
jgi:transposase